MPIIVVIILTSILLAAGCATTQDSCNMGTMSAAQLERALVKGCGR